jgi:hypothetical protein
VGEWLRFNVCATVCLAPTSSFDLAASVLSSGFTRDWD